MINEFIAKLHANQTPPTYYRSIITTPATDNTTLMFTGAKSIYGYRIFNLSTTESRKVIFYDKVTAPLVGDTSLIKRVLWIHPCPGDQAFWLIPMFKVTAGLGFRIVAGLPDSDATALTDTTKGIIVEAITLP